MDKKINERIKTAANRIQYEYAKNNFVNKKKQKIKVKEAKIQKNYLFKLVICGQNFADSPTLNCF